MIIKKVILKNAYKIIYFYFFWLSSFLFREINNQENKFSQKKVKKIKSQKSNRSKIRFDVLTVIIGRSVRFLLSNEFTTGSRYRSLCLIYNWVF